MVVVDDASDDGTGTFFVYVPASFLCLCPCLLSLFMSLPHTVFVYSLFTCLSHFLACLHVYLTCSLAPTIAPVKPSSHLRPAPSSAPSGHALFNEPAYLTTLL